LKGIVDSAFQRFSAHPQEKFEADLELNGEFTKVKMAPSLGEEATFQSLSRGQILWGVTDALESVDSNTSSWLVPFGNPFMLGKVELDLDDMHTSNHLRSLIFRFGHHISSLAVKIDSDSKEDSSRMANLLLELLSMDLSNLKKLTVDADVDKSFVSCLRRR